MQVLSRSHMNMAPDGGHRLSLVVDAFSPAYVHNLSLLLTLGIGGIAHALEYSTSMSFFSDGLDFDTGEVFQDPTVLAIVVGSEDEVERVFRPSDVDIPDFSSDPGVDVHPYGRHH